MKKQKLRLRKCVYDLIIYLCLFGAIICLLLGSNVYLQNYENRNVVDVVKQVLFNSNEEPKAYEYHEEIEPPKLAIVDKAPIIINYLNSVKENITIDELITYETISTWQNYELYDIVYIKEITDNYYLYNVHIKLNKDASLPVPINEKLSTEEYNVITLNMYIFAQNEDYIIKKVDPS